MTSKKQELEQRLNREFEICDRHMQRIEETLGELADLLPMSVEEWNYIRELRNEIAHDYPLLENDVVSILNELISKVPVLLAVYNRLKAIVIL